jgi:hypothetical protein
MAPNRTSAVQDEVGANDPGCVKTLPMLVRPQQTYQIGRRREPFMRKMHSV